MSHFSSIETFADQAKIDADKAMVISYIAQTISILATEFADKNKSDINDYYAKKLANDAKVLDWLARVALAKSEDAEVKVIASSVWLANTAVFM